MTVSLVSTGTWTKQATTGGIRYLPRLALGIDLVLLSVATFVALLTGQFLPF